MRTHNFAALATVAFALVAGEARAQDTRTDVIGISPRRWMNEGLGVSYKNEDDFDFRFNGLTSGDLNNFSANMVDPDRFYKTMDSVVAKGGRIEVLLQESALVRYSLRPNAFDGTGPTGDPWEQTPYEWYLSEIRYNKTYLEHTDFWVHGFFGTTTKLDDQGALDRMGLVYKEPTSWTLAEYNRVLLARLAQYEKAVHAGTKFPAPSIVASGPVAKPNVVSAPVWGYTRSTTARTAETIPNTSMIVGECADGSRVVTGFVLDPANPRRSFQQIYAAIPLTNSMTGLVDGYGSSPPYDEAVYLTQAPKIAAMPHPAELDKYFKDGGTPLSALDDTKQLQKDVITYLETEPTTEAAKSAAHKLETGELKFDPLTALTHVDPANSYLLDPASYYLHNLAAMALFQASDWTLSFDSWVQTLLWARAKKVPLGYHLLSPTVEGWGGETADLSPEGLALRYGEHDYNKQYWQGKTYAEQLALFANDIESARKILNETNASAPPAISPTSGIVGALGGGGR